MNENRHRTLSLMNDIHPEYVVNVAFGGAKDGIDGKIGKDGEPGKDGAPGEDGFSPIVEAYRNPEDTGIIVRVTDKDGTRETYVQDGTSSSSENKPVLYIENESQYTTGYSILRYNIDEIPEGYETKYLDSTFILQVVAIGNGEFSSGRRYSAYFAISFRHDVINAGVGNLPTGITCTYLHGDFKPTFEIKKASNTTSLCLEFIHIGKDVQDAGFEDFEYGTDVAFYVSHYSGNIPYDEFASMFVRGRRISPIAIPTPNYTYLVDVNRSELFNQRLDDVLRFRNYVSGEFDYTTDTSIRATDIEMSTDGDKPGKISLEAAETSNGQTRIQSGKIWLGDYNSSGDYEKLITLDAINNNWRTYQTIIQNGELSLKDLDNGYRTVVISGTSNKPYIDMRSDSNSSTHSIKLQVNGDKGSTNILNGQITLKDESGNKQIDISSRTNGKGIIKMSDVKIAQSETKNGMKLVRLYDTDGDGLFTIGQDGIQYASLDGPSGVTFFDTPQIDKTIPTLPEYPNVQVDDTAFTPTWYLEGRTPQGNDFWYNGLSRNTATRDGHTYLTSTISTDISNSGYNLIYSYRTNVADDRDGSYNGYEEVKFYTSFQNGGYADLLTASVEKPYPGESYPETGEVVLRDAMGNNALSIKTLYDDNEAHYNEVELSVGDGAGTATVDGGTLTPDERMWLNNHRLSDMVTYTEEFTNGGTTDLKTNTIHYATQRISNKEFRYYADCIIEFSTAASGSITITFPVAFRFAETPVFGNNEHWIIGVKANYVVWTKYDISQ